MKVSLNGARDNIEQGKTLDEIAKLDKIGKKIGQNREKSWTKSTKNWTKRTNIGQNGQHWKIGQNWIKKVGQKLKGWTKIDKLEKNR